MVSLRLKVFRLKTEVEKLKKLKAGGRRLELILLNSLTFDGG